jgi:UDP-N-acetylmuramate: L-alanyl-gamma-D-glutamyl-meso-diaminopimelate ligase
MNLYFLGIGGTLMGNLALLAREAGHTVRGSDEGLYPPMSDVLADAGIPVEEGWDAAFMEPRPDLVIMGNAGLPRGHPAVEHVLDAGIPFASGAEWLGRHLLADRHVIAVAGTHGKTTTTAMLAWILEQAGLEPGYLVGGVPVDFTDSARLGNGRHFVVEADEYDCSYFDRRSKFVHYHPRTLVLNNLEYDHADIFEDLGAIQAQFHLLLRTIPANGRIIAPREDEALEEVLARGCWTPVDRVAGGEEPPRGATGRRPRLHERDTGRVWRPRAARADGSRFEVTDGSDALGTVDWSLLGAHNVRNALSAIAAAQHVGVDPAVAVEALGSFRGVKRRMELIHDADGVRVYDDFAHHPTAIRTTLQGLRDAVGSDEIVAVIEPRSHTMSLGSLRSDLATCCAPADRAIWFRTPKLTWDLSELTRASVIPARMAQDVDRLARDLARELRGRPRGADGRPAPCHVVIMSNGSFGGFHGRLVEALSKS